MPLKKNRRRRLPVFMVDGDPEGGRGRLEGEPQPSCLSQRDVRGGFPARLPAGGLSPRWRRQPPRLHDGRGLFPHDRPQVEKVLSLDAGHEILQESGRVLPQHPDQLGPVLAPVWRPDALPPKNFAQRPGLV